jgi:hypothetical protein
MKQLCYQSLDQAPCQQTRSIIDNQEDAGGLHLSAARSYFTAVSFNFRGLGLRIIAQGSFLHRYLNTKELGDENMEMLTILHVRN